MKSQSGINCITGDRETEIEKKRERERGRERDRETRQREGGWNEVIRISHWKTLMRKKVVLGF